MYSASVEAWEQAVLRVCAEINANPTVPLSVHGKVDSSIQAEIEKAVNADMPAIFGSIFMMFLFLMLTLYWMDKSRLILAVSSTAMLGFSVMAQLGIYGWLIHDAHFVKFGGTEQMLFTLVIKGNNNEIRKYLLFNNINYKNQDIIKELYKFKEMED